MFAVVVMLALFPSLALARLEAGAGLSLAWPESDIKDRVEFAWGGEAEYLRNGSFSRQAGQVSYDTILSNTDLFQVRLGASFVF